MASSLSNNGRLCDSMGARVRWCTETGLKTLLRLLPQVLSRWLCVFAVCWGHSCCALCNGWLCQTAMCVLCACTSRKRLRVEISKTTKARCIVISILRCLFCLVPNGVCLLQILYPKSTCCALLCDPTDAASFDFSPTVTARLQHFID